MLMIQYSNKKGSNAPLFMIYQTDKNYLGFLN